MKAVAVTGLGWVTPLGNDIDGVWKKLLEGQSAIRDVPSPHRIRNTKAAVACSYGEGTPAERMLTNGRHAISAALEDAGIDTTEWQMGLFFSSLEQAMVRAWMKIRTKMKALMIMFAALRTSLVPSLLLFQRHVPLDQTPSSSV